MSDPEHIWRLDVEADRFLTQHGVNPHREDLNELDHKVTGPSPDNLASLASPASKERARFVSLLEGAVPSAIMGLWHSFSENLQSGILDNLVLTLEQQENYDKEKLLQRFEYLVEATDKFIKNETRPPIDAYMGKPIPVEDLKLQREIKDHIEEPKLTIADLIVKFEQLNAGTKKRIQ